jgi:hypothetical protein
MGTIPEAQTYEQNTTQFAGYNHKQLIADGEMYDMRNLSGEQYPILSTRRKRNIASYDVEGQDPVPLTGIHGRDQLVFIRGTEVFYNFAKVTGVSVSAETSMLPKKIVSMGAYTCIWPDKVYFNTVDLTDCGGMERRYTGSGENIQLTMARGDGTDYDMTAIATGDTPPANPANNDLWLDQSGENDVLRQWSSLTEEWVEVPTTYVKISATGIGHGLKEYDAVEISGLEAPETAGPKVIAQVHALNGSYIVFAAGEDYLLIAGLISQAVEALEEQDVHIDRTVPDLDYICESNNRLWGCKYGLENGAVVNEIRASKLGDFRNWSTFMGISTDSWTASIGTDGPWTGAITQRGYPVFFKENAIHRVSGTTPSGFSIQTTVARGVQQGSWRSLAVVNENIYYKSRDGIMLYDGNMPISVSEALGDVLYSDARAGALRETYYISMKNANNRWNLFTYDTVKGTWWRQDGFRALGFGQVQDELYAIDEENNTLCAMSGREGAGSGWTAEQDPEWSATFGLYGTDMRQKKYLSRFNIRMYLEENGYAQLFIQYNSSGVWEPRGEIRGRNIRSFVLPVIPKRCDHLQFMISGKGEMRIYAISRILEVGADG